MEGDFEEEINVQITLQVQAAHLTSHLQQEQPLQLHQQEHANQSPPEQHSSSSSFSLPCQDQHFTTYPQLLKRAQLIPMQNHNLIWHKKTTLFRNLQMELEVLVLTLTILCMLRYINEMLNVIYFIYINKFLSSFQRTYF